MLSSLEAVRAAGRWHAPWRRRVKASSYSNAATGSDANPLGRMARPEEIASVVAFLAGDGGSSMTATTVCAAGGIMYRSPGLESTLTRNEDDA
jgi:NAD(P)-dependent dehydrogenase (short-subunit alcohol dehydrogenase family)